MDQIPQGTPDYQKRNPHLFPRTGDRGSSTHGQDALAPEHTNRPVGPAEGASPSPGVPKPLLNKTEQRCCDHLESNGFRVRKQAITLRLDPPYKSYRPDLAYVSVIYGLIFVETKGPHRFREKGIAKAALAAKTYPEFRFELWDWDGKKWKTTVLSS